MRPDPSAPPTLPGSAIPSPVAPLKVRRKQQIIPLLARKVEPTSDPFEVSTLEGKVEKAYPGDYVIYYDNGVAVAVCGPQEFARTYEVLPDEGQTLLLSTADLQAIAPSLRFGATQSTKDFVQAVQGLASVSIGEVKVPFTPGQIAELKLRADKQRLSYEAYVKLIVQHILDNFFIAKA